MSSTTIPSDSGLYESLGQSLSPSWPTSSGQSAIGAVWANNSSGQSGAILGTGGYTFRNMVDPAFGTVKAGTLTLQGKEADIEINGVSLMTVLQGIQERLNILEPNRTLEAEWHQLRELGNQYRALETELLEKQRMWSQLSARPKSSDSN